MLNKFTFKDLKYGSDCDGTQTHDHLICKRTLNDLAKLAK